jgi:hypothetical protein
MRVDYYKLKQKVKYNMIYLKIYIKFYLSKNFLLILDFSKESLLSLVFKFSINESISILTESFLHLQDLAFLPISIHSSSAKFTASAMLNLF